MASNRRPVTVQYRRLADPAGAFGGISLERMLRDAMSAKHGGKPVSDLVEERVDQGDATYGSLVLNVFQAGQSSFFGEIVRFEPGADLPLLALANEQPSYNLTQAKAPDGHEPVRGIAYFMAFDDHFVFFESNLASSRIERYLSWLLGDLSKVIEAGSHVILEADIGILDGEERQLKEVQEVKISPPPIKETVDDELVSVTTSKEEHVSRLNALDVLRAANISDADIERILDDSTSLEVILQIKFKSKRRKKPIASEDAGRLLRNLPDDDVSLVGPAGRQKNGRLVKLSQPAQVLKVGSLLDQKDAARALNDSFHYFRSNGYI